MMRLWRVCAKVHAAQAFSGQGASLYGGRWNPPGAALVYTSQTLSLAALELYVNVEPEDVPGAFVCLQAQVPDGVSHERIEITSLPRAWRRCPAPASLQALGQNWLQRAKTLLLIVPSVVIPEECNVLINPRHPEFSRLAIRPPQPFSFDPRTWTRRPQ